ncbi:hypothetical protein [Bordetella pseudohinzii]|uniref:Uncharacterized protein n=1 Tax=Bordetella pseudohinzii TaxID=1331258 RepID=A0A0J6BZZ5_9BORD|nr:hypothetical protein [Bordetella pseudohinzii]ANY18481.1 hypothetical protein BBN53_20880 [Bordetella pseudohinzii]KMM24116.1 hypothetical protein L540_08295 [Bordetella pseudohinzii]KXA77880.1 hypothetical protein AW878_14390 [Bordetella pseudohinzii]KXA78075.1 hypothetical protein AW877_12845 [Bordetella pseudohinzii]CUJ13205.1 Uncharacterised protein [Bordetella pseudohinzii]
MTKSEYLKARRLIRDNGRYALRWLDAPAAATMQYLLEQQKTDDLLADRAQVIGNMGWGLMLAKYWARRVRAAHDLRTARQEARA